jgi:peptidoglycan-N-acetylglucosamine deacetylase
MSARKTAAAASSLGSTSDQRFAFTLDLEDHRAALGLSPRYPAIVENLLSLLADHGVAGTFFVVGDVARRDPAIVRAIADAGHEIASHGNVHAPIDRLGPDDFAIDARISKACLEEITGRVVTGYRAPVFSLVEKTRWATDVLADTGYRYSSSVLPAANPLYGFAGAPRKPFRWSNGLVEFPCSVIGPGRVALPYLGGTYLRLLPSFASQWLMARDSSWYVSTYCHPYDFDVGEPFVRMAHNGGWVTSRLLWVNRRRMRTRIERLLASTESAGSIGALVDDAALVNRLQVV